MNVLQKIFLGLFILCSMVVNSPLAYAQSDAGDFKEAFLGQFEYATSRLISLAEVMPEDAYSWSPDGEAMPVAQVYMHIARYNFLYPQTALGIESPADINLDTMEDIRDKSKVLELLQLSVDHIKQNVGALTESDLEASTKLYGRSVKGWTVLFQLQTHMSEHVGQSIAYARMNEVTPPWSQ